MSDFDNLYANFRDVSRDYSVRPFWFWNGTLTEAEVQRQIEAMDAQGIHGAHIHNRSGLRPRYLSDEWWKLVRAALDKAKELDFALCVVDEYNWPSGEARDYTQLGYPSRVLAANPDFRMRSLTPETRSVPGGQPIPIGTLADHDRVVVGQRSASGELDDRTLREITSDVRADDGLWQAPGGQWELFIFRLKYTVGVDGGQVDLMNRDAVRTFLDVIYEEYRRHVGSDFGEAFRAFYIDHEGDYGWRLAWTPRLFETFKALKGYDLIPMLPLLLEDGGKRTPTVRCDYFDVVGTLYTESFFQQITDWCNQYGLEVSGHVWEESLQAQTAFQGDHFRIQRALGLPGMDTLFEWGRYPRHFKEVTSVAHFRDLPFTVENQGVQGVDSFLSLAAIKRTTNMLGVWGTTRFIPHALNGNSDRIDFPEDWFERQPWWRFFHHYADYAARISAMNAGGRHVCDVLLYYPIETAWAHGDVCFSEKKWNMGFEGIDTERGQILYWHNVVDELNVIYGEIIDMLPAHLWDLDITDDFYLQAANITDSRLHIAKESFGVLILPPMTTIRRTAAKRAREFFEAGGTVIAVSRLPFDSMEGGREDPELRREWEIIFGTAIVERAQNGKLQHGALERGASDTRGRAAWVASVEALLIFLNDNIERDVRVLQGNASHFFALHRIKEGCHVYWFVNDSDAARDIVVDVPVSGHPHIWDPDGGERRSLFFTNRERRTELHLSLAAWQGVYVVFAPDAVDQPIAVTGTNLADIQAQKTDAAQVIVHGRLPASERIAQAQVEIEGRHLEGSIEIAPLDPLLIGGAWECTPQRAIVPLCYARMRTTTGQGLALGWHLPQYNDSFWESEWLSKERFAIRDWWLLGMFDYHYALGFNEIMPPERDINLAAEYEGRNSEPIRWQRYTSPGRVVDIDTALHTVKERSHAIRWVTAFALSHVYSPDDRTVELRCVADCNAKVWLNDELLLSERDDHQGYLEMRDAFGMWVTARLRQGWNPILLKVSQGIRHGGNFDFVVRFCDSDGQNLPDLRYAASPDDLTEETGAPAPTFERWYRLDVPPGATAVELPDLGDSAQVFSDGTRINDVANGEVALPAGAQLLAICVNGNLHLPDFLKFRTGQISGPLQSWTHTGLSYHTGEFEYTKRFDLPEAYLGYQLVLDLGTVGTTAEVWLNGVNVGERVWQPFAFEITAAARSGANELKVIVANTAANERAGGHPERQLWGVVVRGPELLDHIEENGLLGPVRIIPWIDVELLCS